MIILTDDYQKATKVSFQVSFKLNLTSFYLSNPDPFNEQGHEKQKEPEINDNFFD